MADALASLALVHEVEQFFFHEAELLDERRFEAWLGLLADDIRYRIPLRKNLPFAERERDITGEDDVAWFDDDKPTLVKRVAQIMTGIHWAEEPLSRVSHFVTNVRVLNASQVLEGTAEIDVSCRVLVHRNRLDEETDYFIGRRKDVLRRVAPAGDGPSLQIARRTVILDQSTLLAKNLTIFL